MAKNQMINCPTCGQPMAANAKVCPSCGAKNKQPFYKKWWFWVIVVVLILGIAGSAGSTSGGNASSAASSAAASVPAGNDNTAPSVANTEPEDTVPDEPKPTPVPDLALQGEVTATEDAFAVYYEGVVVNNKDRDLSYAQITFTLYDADGNQIGTALDNINNLKAGGTWKFKAMALCDKDEVADWELTEITGF